MNLWDERYSQSGYAYGTEPSQFLVEQINWLNLKSPLSILSLGEGEGRNAVYLATLGHHVHAVDGSAVALLKAQDLAASRDVRIETQLTDLSNFVIEKRYNIVVMIFCHLPSTLRQKIHKKIVDALAPGGVLIYQAYSPKQLGYGTGGPEQLDLLVDITELKNCFNGMEVIHENMYEKEIIEGKYHTGLAAVTEFVARLNNFAE
mgnify:CR=1 FL=1